MRRGFTLIELLVVISIIAVLAAILFPVFARAREKARQTKCISNQRQIAVAVQMYCQDHSEKFPDDPGASPWTTSLGSNGSDELYDCPTLSGKGSGGAPEYGFNSCLFGMAISRVYSPSNTLISADMSSAGATGNCSITGDNLDTMVDPRHGKAVIISTADGSVRSIVVPTGKTVTEAFMAAEITLLPDN